MSKIGFALAMVAIVAVATWAYNVNYETKTALNRIEALRGGIAAERERIQVLSVEWAWLNNPERLERLAADHADRLALEPLSPARFGEMAYLPDQPSEEVSEAMLLARLDDARALLAALPGAPMGSAVPSPRPAAW